MKRHVMSALLLSVLTGCGFYGSYAAVRDEAVQAAKDDDRRVAAAEIRWTEATYHALTAEVAVRDPLANRDPLERETVAVSVTSATDGTTKPVTLRETASDSGIFRGTLSLVRSFDERSGSPISPGDTRFVVNADQEAARLVAAYAARKGRITAEASYVEPPMLYGQAVAADGTTPMPGASVALERDGVALQTTTARSDGSYAFYDLLPGEYSVKVSLDGVPSGQSKLFNL